MSDEGSPASPEPADASANQSAAFRPGVVIMIVLPIALLMAGGGVFFGLYDGAQWLSDATKPVRVNVAGRVIYNGEPLPDAVIETRPANAKLMGSIGAADDQGKFKLITQIRGDFLDGAYAGEHKVTVKRYDTSVMAFGPPPLLTPSKYASFETTPLRINVKAGDADFVLQLDGELDAPAAADPREEEYLKSQGEIGADQDSKDDRDSKDADAADEST